LAIAEFAINNKIFLATKMSSVMEKKLRMEADIRKKREVKKQQIL